MTCEKCRRELETRRFDGKTLCASCAIETGVIKDENNNIIADFDMQKKVSQRMQMQMVPTT
jgi:Zn finger protein HypA/HybF involved in hydrogenase expression